MKYEKIAIIRILYLHLYKNKFIFICTVNKIVFIDIFSLTFALFTAFLLFLFFFKYIAAFNIGTFLFFTFHKSFLKYIIHLQSINIFYKFKILFFVFVVIIQIDHYAFKYNFMMKNKTKILLDNLLFN
jgi:hypothetical protein